MFQLLTLAVLAPIFGLPGLGPALATSDPASIPVAVEILPDGQAVLRGFQPRAREATAWPASLLPASIPVYTIGPDGTRLNGAVIRNWGERPVSFLEVQRPSRVVVHADGTTTLEVWYASPTVCGPDGGRDSAWADGFPAGFSLKLPDSDRVPVVVADADQLGEGADRGEWNLTIQTDPSTFPEGVEAALINTAAGSVQDQLVGIFGANPGIVRLAFIFQDLGNAPDAPRALTTPLEAQPTFANVKTRLTTFLDEPESVAENAVYGALPPQ